MSIMRRISRDLLHFSPAETPDEFEQEPDKRDHECPDAVLRWIHG